MKAFHAIFVVALFSTICLFHNVSYARQPNRIIGGSEAEPHKYPFMASVQKVMNSSHWWKVWGVVPDFTHYCGGTLINEQWILTAASCVESDSPQDLQVVLGEHDRTKLEGTELFLQVQRIVVHEEYNSGTFEHNIALLELQDRITPSDYYWPLTEWATEESQFFPPETECVSAGWGTVSTTLLMLAHKLQEVDLLTIDPWDCEDSYGLDIYPGMFCAGWYFDGDRDPCVGDGGGPLICESALAGIVSWGGGCAVPRYPGVYTDVGFYNSWIESNLARKSR